MSLLFTDNTWTFDKLSAVNEACKVIADEELHLDYYPNQIEIISSEQMLEAYSSSGMPVMYNHWSYGKHFLMEKHNYKHGYSGLAYEIVINQNPCISYLMEENSMTMQTLVIAHAAYGHNHFFKNNYLFKQYTDASAILDYLIFAKKYVAKCEQKYGYEAVEATLDACHAIADYGVDRYKRPSPLSAKKEQENQEARELNRQQSVNLLYSSLATPKTPSYKRVFGNNATDAALFPEEPEENIMYFIEKYSPSLESWQRELVRIVRKMATYFYPQRQTQLMNEGWASFTHHYIMNRLWEKGQISDGSMLEFIQSHAGVLTQRNYNDKHYSGFNVYALGFEMFQDIKRRCENPTDEDYEYFPDQAGKPWLETCLDAVANYRDESFVTQFLSPATIRKWKLFEVTNNESDGYVEVTGIQNKTSYNKIKSSLSKQYATSMKQANIQVARADLKGSRKMWLRYTPIDGRALNNTKKEVLKHVEFLWGYPVELLDPTDKSIYQGYNEFC